MSFPMKIYYVQLMNKHGKTRKTAETIQHQFQMNKIREKLQTILLSLSAIKVSRSKFEIVLFVLIVKLLNRIPSF